MCKDMFAVLIETDGAAFAEDRLRAVAYVLRRLADDLEMGDAPSTLVDRNGNTCGSVHYRARCAA